MTMGAKIRRSRSVEPEAGRDLRGASFVACRSSALEATLMVGENHRVALRLGLVDQAGLALAPLLPSPVADHQNWHARPSG
jgi:hypothetical protein